MKKLSQLLPVMLTVMACVFGLVLFNPQPAAAKSYQIPRAARGTWYAYDAYNGRYNKLRLTKYGEHNGGYFYKQRKRVKTVKIRRVKYHQIWTTVNPFDVRTSKGRFLGKKRQVLWVVSQGTVTAYFHQRIRLVYQWYL